MVDTKCQPLGEGYHFSAATEKPRTSDLNKVACKAFEKEDSEGNENSRGSKEKYIIIIDIPIPILNTQECITYRYLQIPG